MRPSQYHYLKRMWTRYFYRKSLQKEKHANILFMPFLLIFRFYKIVFFYPLIIFKKIFIQNPKIGKGCITLSLKFFAVLLAISIVFYLIEKFFYLFGYAPLVLLFLFLAIMLVKQLREKRKKNIFQDKNNTISEETAVRSDCLILEKEKQLDDSSCSKLQQKNMSKYEVERYAIMCNAYIEKQEEMKQYKTSEGTEETQTNNEIF